MQPAKNNSNSNSMVNWKTVLTSGGAELGQVVVIRRDIFKKDSLSVLLFIVLMLPPTLVLRKMNESWVENGDGHETYQTSVAVMDDLISGLS